VPYGWNDAEWNRLVDEGLRFLLVRARLGKVTSYIEMNATLARRTRARPFDFELDGERRRWGRCLKQSENATALRAA
jgi:hypothetical protein